MGQNAGEEQVVIVTVGGEEDDIGLAVQRGFPNLHEVRQLAIRKHIQLAEPHLSFFKGEGDALGHGTEGGGQIYIFVEHPHGAGGDGLAAVIVGDGIGTVFQIEQQIDTCHAGAVLQCEGGISAGTAVAVDVLVGQKTERIVTAAGDGGGGGDIGGAFRGNGGNKAQKQAQAKNCRKKSMEKGYHKNLRKLSLHDYSRNKAICQKPIQKTAQSVALCAVMIQEIRLATTTKRPLFSVYSQVDRVSSLSPYSAVRPVS